MFYYFGRKHRIAGLYPKPLNNIVVVEPFAGSMGYTLHHKPEKAIGIEVDPKIVSCWKDICALTHEEILNYPEPNLRTRTSDRWCMLSAGSHGTAKAESYLWTERMSRELKKQKKMAAKYVDYAKNHIEYRCESYLNAPNIEATWFIDPPYQNVRRGYTRDQIDYNMLADWCQTRQGLVIVCEQDGAGWLPFIPLVQIKGINNKKSTEVYWTNG